MIVKLLMQALFFYFIFLLVKNLLKGAQRIKDAHSMYEGPNRKDSSHSHTHHRSSHSKKSSGKGDDDVVEAEFRRL